MTVQLVIETVASETATKPPIGTELAVDIVTDVKLLLIEKVFVTV